MYEKTNVSHGFFHKHTVTISLRLILCLIKHFSSQEWIWIQSPLLKSILPEERHLGEEKHNSCHHVDKKDKKKEKKKCIPLPLQSKKVSWEYVPSPVTLRVVKFLSACFKMLWRGLGMLAPSTGIRLIVTSFWPEATVGGHLRAVCNLASFLSSFPSAFFCWSVAPDHRKSH